MRKLVNRDPIGFELAHRRIQRRKEKNRRASAATQHPEGHLLCGAIDRDEDEVESIAGEAVVDRCNGSHGAAEPAANFVVRRLVSKTRNYDTRAPHRECLPIERPKHSVCIGEECARVGEVECMRLRPGQRHLSVCRKDETHRCVELARERVGTPQPLRLGEDHGG